MASAAGWLAACAAYWAMRPGRRERVVAAAGVIVGALLVLMKVLPFVPGHFDRYEFLALGIWCLLGALMKRREPVRRAVRG